MLIGVDFDNTIACYDQVFPQAALDRGLVPAGVSHTKHTVREHLRAVGNEPAWTELQGAVYGPLMKDATPFPGVLAFFARCVKAGIPVAIVSHRTRTPFLGPQYDLHAAAKGWLAAVGFHGDTGLSPERVFFETRADRGARVYALHRRLAGNSGRSRVPVWRGADSFRPERGPRRVRREEGGVVGGTGSAAASRGFAPSPWEGGGRGSLEG